MWAPEDAPARSRRTRSLHHRQKQAEPGNRRNLRRHAPPLLATRGTRSAAELRAPMLGPAGFAPATSSLSAKDQISSPPERHVSIVGECSKAALPGSNRLCPERGNRTLHHQRKCSQGNGRCGTGLQTKEPASSPPEFQILLAFPHHKGCGEAGNKNPSAASARRGSKIERSERASAHSASAKVRALRQTQRSTRRTWIGAEKYACAFHACAFKSASRGQIHAKGAVYDPALRRRQGEIL